MEVATESLRPPHQRAISPHDPDSLCALWQLDHAMAIGVEHCSERVFELKSDRSHPAKISNT